MGRAFLIFAPSPPSPLIMNRGTNYPSTNTVKIAKNRSSHQIVAERLVIVASKKWEKSDFENQLQIHLYDFGLY